ncbi:MAG: hypothetical protein RR324_07245 [Cellulosilyticaceae bacterium]
MSSNKPILLIDQDDVLVEYIVAVVTAFNNKYGTSFKASECNSWNLISIFGEEIMTVMHEPDLFKDLEPVKDAIETFERLYRSNLFEMYIVTAAHPRTVEAKYEWIKEHMAFLPQSNIIVSSAKHMIRGDYLLDDGMHNIRAFAKSGGVPIIFDRPHNKLEGKEFQRIGSWKEFEILIMNECYADLSESYFDENQGGNYVF